MAKSADTPPRAGKQAFPIFNWQRGVHNDHNLRHIYRLILLRLLLYRGQGGRCDPSYQTIADDVGVDRVTVIRAVGAGVQRGWLAPTTSRGGPTCTNNFVFTFPVRLQGASTVSLQTPSTVSKQTPLDAATVSGGTPNSVQPDSLTVSGGTPKRDKRTGKRTGDKTLRAARVEETDNTPELDLKKKQDDARREKKKRDQRTAQPEDDPDFARFWGVYPRQVAKVAAAKAFAKAVKGGTSAEVLIAGAKRYAKERAGQDPQYTKHPATWISKGCWEDEEANAASILIDEHGNVVGHAEPEDTGWGPIVRRVLAEARGDDPGADHVH